MFAPLLAAAVIYLILGDLTEAVVLSIFACTNVVIAVVQETRTERVLESLRDLTSPRALVIRDGVESSLRTTCSAMNRCSRARPCRCTRLPLRRQRRPAGRAGTICRMSISAASSSAATAGPRSPRPARDLAELRRDIDEMAREGMRVLGVARAFAPREFARADTFILFPPARELFHFGPLHGDGIAVALAGGFGSLVVLELAKRLVHPWLITRYRQTGMVGP